MPYIWAYLLLFISLVSGYLIAPALHCQPAVAGALDLSLQSEISRCACGVNTGVGVGNI